MILLSTLTNSQGPHGDVVILLSTLINNKGPHQQRGPSWRCDPALRAPSDADVEGRYRRPDGEVVIYVTHRVLTMVPVLRAAAALMERL